MTLKVENKVTIYEVDGRETGYVGQPQMLVSSHWNREAFVVLSLGNAQQVTVVAKELKAAIDNATNTAKF